MVEGTEHSPQVMSKESRPVRYDSLSAVEKGLSEKSKTFLTHLESIAREKKGYWGFQKIEQGPNNIFTKKAAHYTQPGVEFTAHNWCTVASTLIQRALEPQLDPKIRVRLEAFHANMFGENWNRTNYTPGFTVGHTVVSFNDGQRKLYVDPTYAQVDSRWKGQFAFVEEADLPAYYGNWTYPIHPQDVTELTSDRISTVLQNSPVKYEDLKPLVEILQT